MAENTSELIRSVTTRLRRYVDDRRRVLRRGARSEARLLFSITRLVTGRGTSNNLRNAPTMVGHTRDISETGLTLLLPSVRIGGAYLTDMENRLEVKLELPDESVTMLTASVRFEQLSVKDDGCGYLLAVQIVGMQDAERDRYLAYLQTINSKERRMRERRQAQPGASTEPNSKSQSGAWEALTPASISNAFEQFLRE